MDKRSGGRIIADYSKLPQSADGGVYLKVCADKRNGKGWGSALCPPNWRASRIAR